MARWVTAFLFQAIFATAAFCDTASPNLQVRIVLDEAEAVLAILDERATTGSVKPESWERLWKSEGFVRLKKRQESFGGKEIEKGFQEFLVSEEALARRSDLRAAVMAWKSLDVTAAARRAAAYLPGELPLRAAIYPVIKKAENSFVFELTTNPAIFMYVDTKVDPAKLENTLAHELHHVGISGCPPPPGID